MPVYVKKDLETERLRALRLREKSVVSGCDCVCKELIVIKLESGKVRKYKSKKWKAGK